MERKMFCYRVEFRKPPLIGVEDREFFFTSIAAIYDIFTAEQIGCRASRLWNLKVTKGNTYRGRECTISRIPVRRKAQTIRQDKKP